MANDFVKVSSLGYGTDPNLITPNTSWALTLSLRERQLANALGDVILPAKGQYPAPSQVGIADFLDEWISAPYPQQVSDRKIILPGLVLADSLSQQQLGLDFLDLTANQRVAVVDKLADSSVGRTFFVRFRYLVVGGYFTSDIGMAAIGYIGNLPLERYAPVSSEVLGLLELELERLGLRRTNVNQP